jgi:RHS repeat-associated protein
VAVTVAGSSSYGVYFAVATSNFTLTSSLNTARLYHTATLLDSGTALIVGGVDGFDFNTISSAELYNPASATFAYTANLNTGRVFNTASLLNNGQVLIAGGNDSNWNNIAQAEIHDPVAATFSYTGSMITARGSHTATVLNNGKVLIAGGISNNGVSITGLAATAEIYDPVASTFFSTGTLNTSRFDHTATLLPNGQVLIAGGDDVNGNPLASAELYNPATGTFTNTGSLNTGRDSHTATLLNNGMVLIAGGYDIYSDNLASAEPYNPATGTFTNTGSLNTGRAVHTATLLSNGMVLIGGGQDNYSNQLNSAELYDPTAATFSLAGGMNSTRSGHTATLLSNGQVLIAAGIDIYGSTLSSAELYQPAALAPPGLVSITVSPQNPSVGLGGTQQLVATGTFSNNSTETLESATWSSSAPSIATVSNDASDYGDALGVSAGVATLSACTGSICGSTTLTVGSAPAGGAPTITGLSPNFGPAGNAVSIEGLNFGLEPDYTSVTFNGVQASPTSWSPTSVSVTVPSGATTGNVVVTVEGVASNAMVFTVVPSVGATGLSDSMGRVTIYSYQGTDGASFVTSIAGSGCDSCGGRGNTGMTYDPLGNLLTSTDALNNTTSYTYDSYGNVLTKTQYLNPSTPLTWTYTYNSFQEVLTAADPAGNTTTNTYDANGNLLSTTTPPPSGSGSGLTTSFQYNTLGELTKVTDPKGNATTLTYTTAGLVATVVDAQNNTTTFTYDGRGNRLTSVDALNNTTGYTYDVMNRLTKITAPDLSTTQFAYDTRGRRISVTDANGKVTSYGYDDADRLTSVTDAGGNLTIYGYDTENNMVDITDAASHQTGFTYDAYGRVTQVTFPSTLSESYSYDAMNDLLSKTDRKGQTISYGYDPLYRLTSKTYPDQTAVNYTYDPLNRLTQVTDPTGSYSFTFDNLGRLVGTGTQYSFMSGTLTNSYGYDGASNRTSFTDAAGYTSSYGYDSLNRLTGLTNTNSGSFGFGYDALGRRTSSTRPNGVNTSYSYDTLSRLLSVLHGGGSLPGSTSYTYDAAGNRLTKTAVEESNGNPVSVLSQFSYDNIYELTQAVVNGSVAEGYTYDAVGNRLTSAGPTSYNYNPSNELTSISAATYAYDNNGNTTSKTTAAGTTYFAWDFEDRLASVTLPGTGGTVNFKYDPFGRRIEKIAPTTGTTVYAYDGDNVTEQLGGGGNLLAHYTQGAGIDEPLAIAETGGSYYYHADGLGSITSLTGGSGQLANSYVYDSFGNLTASAGTVTNPFQYTAREFDSETGLYYYRERYYDPGIGRFLSEDSLGFYGGTNFFTYTANGPIGRSDPFGAAYYLTYSNGTIYVNASVTLYGPRASSQLAQQWQDAVYNTLNNGHYQYNGCDIRFNIQFIADPSANHFWTATDNAAFLPAGQNAVYVDSDYGETGTVPKYSYGHWDRGSSDFIVAHEMSHFLWLPDTYDSRTHQPQPGAEHWLTSDQGGNNTEIPRSQINDILKGVWPDWNRPTNCGCER